ncbi:MAG: SUF system NifU family Fe-S cluster assembly protein [Cellulomonadaceae bacterium]|jgi:nitrogen fixation NifU-like protein|nr:SUF system NifU family Fe-S cluster assembly protein [Cellulomonadaceae bacterium]
MTQLYQQLILEHSKTPTGRVAKGELEGANSHGLNIGTSHQVNPTCGDEITLVAKFEGDKIADIIWEGQGCAISQASASVMTDMAIGQTATQVTDDNLLFHELMHSRGAGLTDPQAIEQLGDAVAFTGVSQYPARIKCALLGWEALRAAIHQAQLKGE